MSSFAFPSFHHLPATAVTTSTTFSPPPPPSCHDQPPPPPNVLPVSVQQLNHQAHVPPPAKLSTLRTRLSRLCKENRLDAARRLFDSLLLRPSAAPAPATILWNTLLIGYVCNSLPADALRLYALMNSSHGHPRSDAYTYSSALKACADARQLRLGKSIHCHIIRRSIVVPPKNCVLNNSLLNMYASVSDPSVASRDVVRLLFNRIPKRNVVAWNTLIAWYVRSQRPTDALAQFKLMLEVGIRPTPVSFVGIFPVAAVAAFRNVECWRCSDVLYGLLVKHGSEFVNDQFVVSSAILMYCDIADMISARLVFDQAEEKNTEVWNTMIGGYIENGQLDEALSLFLQILELDVITADTVTFLSSLMAVSQIQDVSLGQQIHARLIKNHSLALPLILQNALVVMYSRSGYVWIAFDLFNQMTERDAVSWNTMITAFVQNNLNLEGLLLACEMQKQGFTVDSVTVVAILSAASNLGSLRIGRETHGYLIRHGIHCEGMESYLIDMYAKSGCVEIARQLFDSIPSNEIDQVTWNAMIAGYTQSGQTELAITLFQRMLDEGQTPSSVTLASVLPACNPIGGIQAGKQIHGFAIRHCLDNNVFVSTALVDMYSKCGQISTAKRVFDGIAYKNTVTYSTMLSGFGQHGLGEQALSLFRSMQESRIKPDAITLVAVMAACSYSGLVDEGLAIYESMGELGIVPAPEHYCCVVDLLGRAGRVEEAYQFVEKLGEDGNFIGIWGSLLAACKVHRKFELGEVASSKLFEIGKESSIAGYHVLLSNVYAEEGHWDNVDRVRREMRQRGLRKEPGSSWIDVGDTSHKFMSKDQTHPENDQISAMLQELTLQMKSSGDETLGQCLDGWSELDK